MTRDHPWASDLADLVAAPRPIERRRLPPLGRDELAALIEGIEGERPSASLLLLIAERSGGIPLVAEELLAARRELPRVSLTGSLDDFVAGRMAIRSLECRRVLRHLAPAGRALEPARLAIVGRDLRGRHGPPRAAYRHPAQRSDGVLDAELTAGVAEALEHGFLVERTGAIGFRHELDRHGHRPRPAAGRRARHHAGLAVALADLPAAAADHWLQAGDRAAARRAAIDAAEAPPRDAAANELAALEAALALTEAPAATEHGREPVGRAGRTATAGLQVRAAEASLPRDACRGRPPISSRRSERWTPVAIGSWRVACSSGSPRSGGRRATRWGRDRGAAGRGPRAARGLPGAGHRSWPPSPSC